MKSWLRALIDGLACIGSFGAMCGGRRRVPNVWTMPEAEQNDMIRRYVTQADIDAIASDWRVVGDDLRAAMDAEWKQSNRDVQQAITDGTVTAEHMRRHRTAYDRYIDARTARAR